MPIADEVMTRTGKLIGIIADTKAKLASRGLTAAKRTCPCCGEKDALHVGIAGPRKHIRMKCTNAACGVAMME